MGLMELKLEDKDKQSSKIVAEDTRVVIRTPKANTTKKASRSCKSCFNRENYEPIDSVVGHETHLTYYRIVSCSINIEGYVHLSVVSSQHDNKLMSFEGNPLNMSIEQARDFLHGLRVKAGIPRARKLKVLVNPVGGQGNAIRYYNERVFPILRSSGCTVDLQMLEYKLHAFDIAKEMDLSYDAIVCVSGDGAVHEVLNGFLHHQNPIKAIQTPLCPIPAGSGNSLSLCLLGLEEGFDISLATLNAIKGHAMPLDLFSIMQGNKRTLSYLTQATGLMADLDIGTEDMRWLGDTRFVIGYVRSLVRNAPCPCEIYIKVEHDDKNQMVNWVRERHLDTPVPVPQYTGSELPKVQYPNGPEFDWEKVSDDISYLYAGQVPWVSRDLKQFPVSMPNDGFIDVAVQLNVSRMQKIKAMDGAENGAMFFDDSLKYYKAKAYHFKPLQTDGYISIDGESAPILPFTVEIMPSLARVLSPYYTWNNQF
ncbi:hypothetical protein E3P92_02181 [Wallemia ichthyophaga]|nr:hypothetical protein E3P91_01932 [Wallemia ichthyophaga]TIB13683.1 hypothetical protein E3P92_02181 [Wallemia ichthyophaga]